MATTACALAAAVALTFAVIAAVIWWRAGHNSTRSTAAIRDTVALDARLDVEAVNTSDYRHASAALQKWLSVSTGALHGEFQQTQASAVALLGKAKIITTATVLDAAVTDLDVHLGKATVIASVNVKKQPIKGAAALTRNRFQASMTRSAGRWKLSDLKIVSVQLA